jgi:hypothetical protein
VREYCQVFGLERVSFGGAETLVTNTNLDFIWAQFDQGCPMPGWDGRRDGQLCYLTRAEDGAAWCRQVGDPVWVPLWPQIDEPKA